MRFIHTADWHLGRLFHGVHLTEDQAHVLDQFTSFVKDAHPDVVIVAGDIYDRAVPPPDAIALLDEVLSKIILDFGVPVVLISGNHDSAGRLSFGAKVLKEQHLHVIGVLSGNMSPVMLEDKSGPVHIYPVPYAEPSTVREKLDDETIRDHDTAMKAIIEKILSIRPNKARSVLVAHAFAAGGMESDSERPLSVGGAGNISVSCLSDFDYVALGHLHRPQSVGQQKIQYAGSLIKYSFSETDHIKSVNLVEMESSGTIKLERVSFTPRRDVRRIEGYLNDILAGPESGESKDDYLMVSMLDKGPILDVMGKLRQVYPNVLHVERPSLTMSPAGHSTETPLRYADQQNIDHTELFKSFFSQVTGEELSGVERDLYRSIIESAHLSQEEQSP